MSALGARPPKVLPAGPIDLVAYTGEEVEVAVRAIGDNLEHLRPWMPWAQEPPTAADEEEFVRRALAEWDSGRGFFYWLREGGTGEMVGGAGLHARVGADALEIGYWVGASRVRRGYATAAARALTSAALALPGIRRVEIHCDAANAASAAVPRRLGYHLVRVEDRPIEAPGETGRQLVFEVDTSGWEEATGAVESPATAAASSAATASAATAPAATATVTASS